MVLTGPVVQSSVPLLDHVGSGLLRFLLGRIGRLLLDAVALGAGDPLGVVGRIIHAGYALCQLLRYLVPRLAGRYAAGDLGLYALLHTGRAALQGLVQVVRELGVVGDGPVRPGLIDGDRDGYPLTMYVEHDAGIAVDVAVLQELQDSVVLLGVQCPDHSGDLSGQHLLIPLLVDDRLQVLRLHLLPEGERLYLLSTVFQRFIIHFPEGLQRLLFRLQLRLQRLFLPVVHSRPPVLPLRPLQDPPGAGP